jgi:hypothetical protein
MRDERQRRIVGNAFAQPIGGAGEATRSEGFGVQDFDRRLVVRVFEAVVKRTGFHRGNLISDRGDPARAARKSGQIEDAAARRAKGSREPRSRHSHRRRRFLPSGIVQGPFGPADSMPRAPA